MLTPFNLSICEVEATRSSVQRHPLSRSDSGSTWLTCGSFSNKHICCSDKNPKYTDIIVCKDLLVGLWHTRIKHSVFTCGDCVLLDDGFRRGDSAGLLSPGKI